MRRLSLLVVALCSCAGISPAFAQTGTGTVTDVTIPTKGGHPTVTILLDTSVSASSRAALKATKGSKVSVALTKAVPPVVTPPEVTPAPVVKDTVKSPVTLPPVTPPIVTAPSGGACNNEPAGATRFEDQPWNVALPPKWLPDYDSWPKDNGAIVQDATAPMSPSSVVAGKFAKGDPGGSAPFYVYRPFSATTEKFSTLYVCVVMKHSADFDNTNGNAGTKVFWPAGDQIQGASTYITLNTPTMDVGVNLQGVLCKQDAENGREMYANLGDGHVFAKRGQWIVYEFLLKANSSDTARDGGYDLWLDGVHVSHYADACYRMGTGERFWRSFAWNPTYGGGKNPVPHDQYEFIDHLRLSGVR